MLAKLAHRRGDGAVFVLNRLLNLSHVGVSLYLREREYADCRRRVIYLSRQIYATTADWPDGTLSKRSRDATRLRILGLLLTGEVCVCDIHESLKIPQPKASRHLAYLRRAGLVETRREGLWMHYRLADARRSGAGRDRDAVRHALTHVDVVRHDAERLQKKTGCCVPTRKAIAGLPCCAPAGDERVAH